MQRRAAAAGPHGRDAFHAIGLAFRRLRTYAKKTGQTRASATEEGSAAAVISRPKVGAFVAEKKPLEPANSNPSAGGLPVELDAKGGASNCQLPRPLTGCLSTSQ